MHDFPTVGILQASDLPVNEILCDHCEGPLTGNAYRVLSEEDGVRLLDMVVCHACYLEARRIGLETAELGSMVQQLPGRS
jgi:hypothetical protein